MDWNEALMYCSRRGSHWPTTTTRWSSSDSTASLFTTSSARKPPGLLFELDTYWVQCGGMSPERWIRELGSKLVSIHLKDCGVAPGHGEPPFMAEVGQGNLDFHTIVAEAELVAAGGLSWNKISRPATPSIRWSAAYGTSKAN
jgi:sugar phosphate isomerase/epimerase